MSEIKTNKLTGYTNAGDVDVTSEHGNVTMRLQQGLVKQWIFYEADNSNLIRDSFNISSLRDNATGHQGTTCTNPMNTTSWSAQVSGSGGNTSSGYGTLDSGGWGGNGDQPYRTTTQVNFRFVLGGGNGATTEHNDCNFAGIGDLA